jgi:hypothetical protein
MNTPAFARSASARSRRSLAEAETLNSEPGTLNCRYSAMTTVSMTWMTPLDW